MSGFKFLDRGFRETLVLIPGWATDWRIFGSLDLNYSYLLCLEVKPDNFSNDLAGWLDKSQIEKISLFGCSLGGFLAADFSKCHPERVNALFLSGIRRAYNSTELEDIAAKLKKDKRAWLYKFYLHCFSREDKQGLAWFKNNLLKKYLEEMKLNALLAWLDYLGCAKIIPQDLRKIKNIKIFQGEDDAIAPVQEARQIKKGLTQAELIYLSGLGHINFLTPIFKHRFYG